MRHVVLADGGDLGEWRRAARALLAARVPPPQVQWAWRMQGDLLEALADPLEPAAGNAAAGNAGPMPDVRVPREFLALAELVLAHADPHRHALLYRLLWRLVRGERTLLSIVTDPDVAWARAAASAVRRERHKMKAFVRFREMVDAGGPVYVAWFEPAHDVLPLVAPFFARRFAGMRWSILTPSRSAYWDGIALHPGPGASRSDAPGDDALEDLWRVYYASTFNPARLKVDAMCKEMPVRYWKHLPEARLIPALVRDAGARMGAMLASAPTLPRKPRLEAAAAPHRDRRGCG
ncbi:MAG: TIGR03915 family putative DNA repair protein [Thermomonas haemolytica]